MSHAYLCQNPKRQAEIQKDYWPDALVELKLIQIELESRRIRHARHFIDPFYCYKNGIVNKNGKAKTDALLTSCYVTSAAYKKIIEWEKSKESANKKDTKVDGLTKVVTRDHVVPVKLIEAELNQLRGLESGAISIDAIEWILDRYLLNATITHDENAWIRKKGLTSSMPPASSSGSFEILGRYQKLELDLHRISDLRNGSIVPVKDIFVPDTYVGAVSRWARENGAIRYPLVSTI